MRIFEKKKKQGNKIHIEKINEGSIRYLKKQISSFVKKIEHLIWKDNKNNNSFVSDCSV